MPDNNSCLNPECLFHYTDKVGWNAIRSQREWIFKTSTPPSPERPAGVYFTDIPPTEQNLRTLYKRLRIPKIKQEYVFAFSETTELIQLNGGRGRDQRIYYASDDYHVIVERQRYQGESVRWREEQ